MTEKSMRYTLEEMDQLQILFNEHEHDFITPITFEEMLDKFVVKCENCGKFMITDEPLPLCTNYKGERFHCCNECYRGSEEYELSIQEEPPRYEDEYEDRLVRGLDNEI